MRPPARTAIVLCASAALLSPALAAPPPPSGEAIAPLSSGRMRAQLMAAFMRRPLDVRAMRARRAEAADAVPGGAGFVMYVDADRNVQNTVWADGLSSSSTMQLLAEKYYEVAPDTVQFIVVFTSFRIGAIAAFYMPLANDVLGIGYKEQGNGRWPETFDNTGDSPLDGIIMMNSVDEFAGPGTLSSWVFNQELGHRWGSFVHFLPDGAKKSSDALLGRDLQHWSYFLDTGQSPMEGNRWIDNGDGTFTTQPILGATPYMPFDLYAMGLLAAKDVPPMMLIETPAATVPDGLGGSVDRASTPEGTRRATITGTRRMVPIEQIIAAEGPRVPSVEAAPKEFHIGFLLVVKDGQQAQKAILDRMQKRVDAAVAGWQAATGGRGRLVVESHGVNPELNPLGTPCPAGMLQCDPAAAKACVAPAMGAALDDAGAPVPVCAIPCDETVKCPVGGCCAPGLDGATYCFPRPLCQVPDLGPAAPGKSGCSVGPAGAVGSDGAGPAAAIATALLAGALLVGRRRARRPGR